TEPVSAEPAALKSNVHGPPPMLVAVHRPSGLLVGLTGAAGAAPRAPRVPLAPEFAGSCASRPPHKIAANAVQTGTRLMTTWQASWIPTFCTPRGFFRRLLVL